MKPRILVPLCASLLAASASASLVYQSGILLSAQGFGSAPRDLTISETGPNQDGTESGCVRYVPGQPQNIVIGPAGCTGNATILPDPNGVIPTGGDEPPPLSDDNKYGIPTLGSLGITSLNQIGILFNATEPGGDSANVTDITLNFFNAAGALLASIDGSHNFLSSNPGNGVAGFVFVIDAPQQALLAAIPGLVSATTVLSLNSTITDISGGNPETFTVVNLSTAPPAKISEPGSLALLGIAALGTVVALRRRRSEPRRP
ncbi:MAG TPA: PEP-CTERM sorting domain-containing protein, partial [Casimicrobiaceae bacterium]|nr:PEP-CTERM sorting domain-containing protein [Casimicrobiaceae bacterium]